MVEELGSMVMVEEPWEMIRDPGFIVLVVSVSGYMADECQVYFVESFY